MTDKRVWLITGAGRGMGVDIAKAALAAGHAERTAAMVPAWKAMNGQQQGDPTKFAAALVQIVDQEQPPLRWVAGADAVAGVEQKAKDLLAQVDAYRYLSTSLALDAVAAGS